MSPLSNSPRDASRAAVLPRPAILMVDDHPANLLALEGILAPLDVELVRANSGEEALKWVLKREFAVILMDVQMPGMDGFRTVQLIKERERSRHVPVIFLTAISRDAAHVFQGYAHGAVDYLLKPFEPEILRSKVMVFVELYRKNELLKRQEAELRAREREALERKSELRFRQLTDLMPQCMWASKPDGAIYYTNRVLQEYAGLEPDRLTLQALTELTHEEDREPFKAALTVSFESGERFELSFRLRRHDGEYRWFLGRAAAERTEAGAVAGWICTATDIDDAKRAEEALRQTQRELERANAAKDEFLAAASHELRTPLQAAKGHAHLTLIKLGPEQADTPIAKGIKVVMRQIDRMTQLVESLLDVSRIQAGRLAIEVEPFNFSELLRDVVDRTGGLSHRHELTLDAGASLEVVGDRSRLEQVVTNLLSNAVRYSPEGGRVEVVAGREGDAVHLQVRDSGVGIPKEKQAVIFERFGRAHGSRYGGLGLGLTISQAIVEQHGGRIWVESDGEARGSTFHVVFPARARREESAAAPVS